MKDRLLVRRITAAQGKRKLAVAAGVGVIPGMREEQGVISVAYWRVLTRERERANKEARKAGELAAARDIGEHLSGILFPRHQGAILRFVHCQRDTPPRAVAFLDFRVCLSLAALSPSCPLL